MCSPYNDLVWEHEWPKIVEKARKEAKSYLLFKANKTRRQLGLPTV